MLLVLVLLADTKPIRRVCHGPDPTSPVLRCFSTRIHRIAGEGALFLAILLRTTGGENYIGGKPPSKGVILSIFCRTDNGGRRNSPGLRTKQ